MEGKELFEIWEAWSKENPGRSIIDFLAKWIVASIEQAILAEREACAKIAEKVSSESETCAKRVTDMREKRLFTGGKIACDSVASKIRARSNPPELSLLNKLSLKEIVMPSNYEPIYYPKEPAPEAPNKPLESPESLQVSTYPASILKTCT